MNPGEQQHTHGGCEEPAEEKKTLPSIRSSDGGVSSVYHHALISHIFHCAVYKILFKGDLGVLSLICLVKMNSSSADLEPPVLPCPHARVTLPPRGNFAGLSQGCVSLPGCNASHKNATLCFDIPLKR